MTQFKGFSGLSEAQLRLLWSFLFRQDATGLATDGVLTGLGVAQTTTASGSVVVSAGFGVSQDSVLNGAVPLALDSNLTLDVLVANPMGGVPRNDMVVFDAATLSSGAGGVRVIVGTPNAVPTDPTVPATAVPLARLRHAASATTVPTAKIDDLRVKTSLFGAADENNRINGLPLAGTSVQKVGKRFHWGFVTITPGGTGYATVTHNAGFTPTVVTATSEQAYMVGVDTFTATTFQVRILNPAGVSPGAATKVHFFCGE